MNKDIRDGLVNDWDEVYKKGQLGLWVLLSIYEERRYTAEIIDFMSQHSNGHFEVKEQSLYRALRRFDGMGLVDAAEMPSPNSGSNRKYYGLTPLGKTVLGQFIQLQIIPLFEPKIATIIKKAAKEAKRTNEKSS